MFFLEGKGPSRKVFTGSQGRPWPGDLGPGGLEISTKFQIRWQKGRGNPRQWSPTSESSGD